MYTKMVVRIIVVLLHVDVCGRPPNTTLRCININLLSVWLSVCFSRVERSQMWLCIFMMLVYTRSPSYDISIQAAIHVNKVIHQILVKYLWYPAGVI